MASMLQEGTKNRTAAQIQDELALSGAFISLGADEEHVHLGVYTLARFLPGLLGLLREMLTEPAFDAHPFDLLKAQALQNFKVGREKTSVLASEAFNARIFGPDSFLGAVPSEEEITKLIAWDAQELYFNHLAPQRAEIFLAGQFEDSLVDEVAAALEPILGQRHNEHAAFATAPAYSEGEQVAVKKAGSRQVSLRIGRRIFGRNHPDYFAMRILTEAFGGYFGSRLMKNVREEKGLTYGISARLRPVRGTGALVIGADVNHENHALAVQEVFAEMRRLQDEPLPSEEMETVRNYMLGEFASSLGTVFQAAEKHKLITLSHLPVDYHTRYLEAIQSITPSQLQRSAQTYLRPEDMLTVAAGV
jgi:predicted Zn-dependent peptidase